MRVVAADHGGDPHRRRQAATRRREILAGRLRRRIASVGERMHERRHAGRGEDLRQRHRVVLVRMHAARRDAGRGDDRCRRSPCSLAMRSTSAGARAISPDAMASPMRGRSCMTTRPAPMLRWPTSELPIWPSGRPTSRPEVRRKACGPVPHSRSKVGVRAWQHGVVGALLAPTPAVENHQHHRTTCLHVESAFPRSHPTNSNRAASPEPADLSASALRFPVLRLICPPCKASR